MGNVEIVALLEHLDEILALAEGETLRYLMGNINFKVLIKTLVDSLLETEAENRCKTVVEVQG